MGYYTNQIQLVNLDGMSDFDRIDQQLKTLIVSIEKTLPGSRGFGISPVEDMNPREMRNTFFSELDDKVEKYIPEISIRDIEIAEDENGTTKLRILIEENDDMEEAEEEDD